MLNKDVYKIQKYPNLKQKKNVFRACVSCRNILFCIPSLFYPEAYESAKHISHIYSVAEDEYLQITQCILLYSLKYIEQN